MKRREHEDIPQEKDRGLDIPAEANRDKHINFLDTADSNLDTDSDSPFFLPNNSPLKNHEHPGGNRA